MSNHEILILGANFGGVGVAHYILRHTIPALKSLDPSRSYHVTLVGPSKSFYFKVGVPRALADPDALPLDKVFVPLDQAFAEYDASIFTFVQGLATALDGDKKIVTVTLHNGSTKALPYNSLVISTGTTAHPLWTVNDDLTQTKAAHQELHEKLPKAKSVLVAGGGPAGVETAGEIASKYPQIQLTLVPGGERVLPRLSSATSGRATSYLKKLGVVVKENMKVVSAESSADGTHLKFDDGTEATVDVYIGATGGKPNTSFLPASWLDPNGKVITDDKTLRGVAPGVYGIGDAASYSSGGIADLLFGTKPMASSLGRDIVAQLVASNGEGGRELQKKADSQAALKDRPFKSPIGNPANSQIVPIGRKGGVGQIMGVWLPSFAVYLIKGKDFMIGRAQETTRGADYVKA